jgi:hypothetical protein
VHFYTFQPLAFSPRFPGTFLDEGLGQNAGGKPGPQKVFLTPKSGQWLTNQLLTTFFIPSLAVIKHCFVI